MVELACNDDGCALIPDDGNPYNDVIPQAPQGQYNDGIVDSGHYHEEPMSTHGISLNVVGGNVATAPGTNPELAASAVTSTESVI